MSVNVFGWPVMLHKCPSCPFGKNGDMELRHAVLNRTTFNASQICHHPRLHGRKESHLCRGARDHQLVILHRLGWIEAEKDEAFAAASRAHGVAV